MGRFKVKLYLFYPCKLINNDFHCHTYPGTGEVSWRPSAATWPWCVLMDEVLGQRPSSAPTVITASVPEDTLGPSAAAGDQEEKDDDDEEEKSQPEPRRKRRREDELIQLLKEDKRLQREAEERRDRESRERMERLFSLLETTANRYFTSVVIYLIYEFFLNYLFVIVHFV